MVVKKRHIWFILLCAYIVAVAYLCFMKPDDIPALDPYFLGIPVDKLAHFLMFFPFPIVSYGAFMPESGKKAAHLVILLVLTAAGLGLAIGTEHVQGQLGYRSEDIHDFYADLAGIICSAVLTMIYILAKRK